MSLEENERVGSFVKFEVEPPLRLTEESVGSLRARLDRKINLGGLSVHGVGWFIADLLPVGLSPDEVAETADRIATQVQCENVAGSIRRMYIPS